ncbi:protein-glucosylgalactosylhydroxylysine glucosidase-like [Liolophura sinensis]|uniref:protein-glucosylgalactosylhydroxylysine glucosidase-like n=1 Tax=Liolophura sinensis TaxID=3198878 RepID=UPI0031595AED
MERNCKQLVEWLLDMKLKTVIVATLILVFLLFAGICYKTSPWQRKPYLKLHNIQHRAGNRFGQPVVKDELPPDKVKPPVQNDLIDLEKKSNNVESAPEVLPHRSHDIQRLLGNVPPHDSIFQVDQMPTDRGLWPTVGNGHIATVVNSDTIHMNGLYNGAQATSHRARIPALIAIEISIAAPKVPVIKTYSLEMGGGIFNETTVGTFFRIEKLTYAHRTYRELFVVELKIKIHDHPTREPLILKLSVKSDVSSDDLDITEGTCDIPTVDCSYVHGTVKQPECEGEKPGEVHIFYTDIPTNITMDDGMVEEASHLYLMSLSPDPRLAKDKFDNGFRLNQRHPLSRSHMSAWASIWAEGRMDMGSNSELAQLSYSSLYYILSCLPLEWDVNNPFGGMSLGGLANGEQRQGHVTGDQERWIFPPLLLLHSNLSRSMLDYRAHTLKVAMETAASQHYKGALYSWETAYSGRSVSSDKSADLYRHYSTGDLALAVQQYMWLTNDTSFLTRGQGSDLVKAIAEFWESRITYDTSKKLYKISGVMPPGKSSFLVNNSMYTNSVANISLMLPHQLFPEQGIPFSDKFKAYADSLFIPFDENLRFNPAFDKYQPGSPVKEPEVLLLNIALTDDIGVDVEKKNLKVYEKSSSASRSPLTHASVTMNWLFVKDGVKAEESLSRCLQSVRGPFKVWSEHTDGTGAVSFVPAMAAYLQTLLYGYAGFRIQQQQLAFDPVLPPKVTQFTVHGVDYLGQSLTFVITKDSIVISLTPSRTRQLLLIVVDLQTTKTHTFKNNRTVRLKAGTKGVIRQLRPQKDMVR